MNTTALDTLRISKELQQANLKPEAADKIAEILQLVRDTDDARLATKADLRQAVAELKTFVLTVVGSAATVIVAVLAAIKYFG